MKLSKSAICGILAALLLPVLTACGASPAAPAPRSTAAAPLAARVTKVGFPDVSEEAWYAEAVQYVTENGLMDPMAEGFAPDEAAERGVIAEVLCRAFGRENGVINGRTGGLFDPRAGVTRAEVAAIVQRYLTLRQERAESEILLTVEGTPLAVTWADNSSVDALKELLKDGPVTL